MSSEQTDSAVRRSCRAGKYLTLRLADEAYGLEILKVREIIGWTDVTPVPTTPRFVKGVINLRGKVIPVMDLRLKFGMPEKAPTPETCIIVVQVGGAEIGVVVDRVLEVLGVADDDIEDAPFFGPGVATEFILGVGKTGGKVTLLLDIDKALTQEEAAALAVLAAADA